MSDTKLCGDSTPHGQHGWTEEVEVPPVFTAKNNTTTKYHHCPGVRGDNDWFDKLLAEPVQSAYTLTPMDPVLDDEGAVLVPDRPREERTPQGYTLDARLGQWYHNDSGVFVRDPALHAQWLIDLDRRFRD